MQSDPPHSDCLPPLLRRAGRGLLNCMMLPAAVKRFLVAMPACDLSSSTCCVLPLFFPGKFLLFSFRDPLQMSPSLPNFQFCQAQLALTLQNFKHLLMCLLEDKKLLREENKDGLLSLQYGRSDLNYVVGCVFSFSDKFSQ